MPSKPEIRRQQSQRYYSKNREEIAAKKKEKYENDPEYRAQVKERAKINRKIRQEKRRKAKEASVEIEDVIEDAPSSLHKPKKYKIVEPGGKRSCTVLMYPISYLAQACECSKDNIQRLAQKDVIPDSQIYRTSTGYRIFTEDQIQLIARLYKKASIQRMPDGRPKTRERKVKDPVTGKVNKVHQPLRRRKFMPELKVAIDEEWQNLVAGVKPERFETKQGDQSE